jgi:hypothetical protein
MAAPELKHLQSELAKRRAEWVPKVAPNAVFKKADGCWHLGDISGKAGHSLLIWKDADHEYHKDMDGSWTGDDLELIGCLCRCRDFVETLERAGSTRRLTSTQRQQ